MNSWTGKWQPHHLWVEQKYENVLYQFLINDEAWAVFKTYPTYNGIVGNDSQSRDIAIAYLDGLKELSPAIYNQLPYMSYKCDGIGSPLLYDLDPELRAISPGTIIYAYTLADIERHFGPLDSESSIVEIGAGYGGQMTVALLHQPIAKYSVVDLEYAIMVIQKYMQYFPHLDEDTLITYHTTEALPTDGYGLAVSNFCLTELDDAGIDSYIDNIFLNCNNCYIQSNFKANAELEYRDWGREERLVSRLEEIFKEVNVLSFAEGFSHWRVSTIIGKGRK